MVKILVPRVRRGFFILGNHDDRRLMQETFGDTHSHIPTGGGFLNNAIEDHPLRLVSLDSLINGEVCGIVDEAQRGWLDATLSEPPGHADNRHAVSPAGPYEFSLARWVLPL